MRIVEMQGTNMDLTPAIKARAEKALGKVAKLLQGVEPADVRADLGMTTKGQKNGDVFRAEYNLQVPGDLLRAESTRDDLYQAIDQAANELRRQVKKYKDKK